MLRERSASKSTRQTILYRNITMACTTFFREMNTKRKKKFEFKMEFWKEVFEECVK